MINGIKVNKKNDSPNIEWGWWFSSLTTMNNGQNTRMLGPLSDLMEKVWDNRQSNLFGKVVVVFYLEKVCFSKSVLIRKLYISILPSFLSIYLGYSPVNPKNTDIKNILLNILLQKLPVNTALHTPPRPLLTLRLRASFYTNRPRSYRSLRYRFVSSLSESGFWPIH